MDEAPVRATAHNKELEAILKVAERAGWRVKGGGQRHFKCFSPDGETIIVISSSASRGTGWTPTRRRFRRAGLEGV
jgi:hypothetical protein